MKMFQPAALFALLLVAAAAPLGRATVATYIDGEEPRSLFDFEETDLADAPDPALEVESSTTGLRGAANQDDEGRQLWGAHSWGYFPNKKSCRYIYQEVYRKKGKRKWKDTKYDYCVEMRTADSFPGIMGGNWPDKDRLIITNDCTDETCYEREGDTTYGFDNVREKKKQNGGKLWSYKVDRNGAFPRKDHYGNVV